MRVCFGAAAATFLISGCASYSDANRAVPPTNVAPARAELFDTSGRNVGLAFATQMGNGLTITVAASGLSSGAHGVHVHQTGACNPPDFNSAGPHWNPSGRQHGKDNPAGMHRGDLPNILIGANGEGSMEYVIPTASLAGPGGILDADGGSIVIHATADDNRTDPSGNSGARIACGVFR